MIVGAGVLGLCTAFELHRRGRSVVVIDPGGANASAVAAGMIAPAMEAAIDDASPERAALFRVSRDLWPDFARAAGIALARRPAEWRGGDAAGIAARMRTLGFQARLDGERVVTDEEYQVDPGQALAAMTAALGDAVVNGRVKAVSRLDDGWRVETDRGTLRARALVLATGAEGAIAGLPEAVREQVAAIQPVRGQIGMTKQTLAGHVVRGTGAYVAPMGAGVVVGATMEPGRRDTAPDAATGERLLEAAWRVLGRTPETLEIDWRAGVRGASADGLPLAGAAPGGQGVFMALAPRRNGWLLGPLVGAAVADAIEGEPASPHARTLDPGRF
ncbi:Glycine oxidase [Brevundimonas sp. SH203]|nr:Glycine oxidase [Brevundimonas sp. SH203]